MENNIFIKIPNNFIKSNKEGNGGLLKDIDNKLLLVASYLYLKRDLLGESSVTLEDIIVSCGYKTKAGVGKTNETFKKILVEMQDRGLILGFNNNVKLKELIKIKFNFFETNNDNKDINFFTVDYKVFEKIKNCDNNIDKAILYNLYCYIKSCIKTIDKSVDQVATGGNYPVAYPSYKAISKNTGISEGTIKSYLDVLVNNKLILFKNAGVYSPEGNKKQVYESNNTYIIYTDENSEEMLDDAIKFYKNRLKNNGYIFKKGYKTDNRVIGGKMTAIKNKIKAGNATKKELEKLEELEAMCNKTTRTEVDIIKNLLENKKIISEHYLEVGNEKASDKYAKIEEKLGLINKELELIVPYDTYYKEMYNYFITAKNIEEIGEKIEVKEKAKVIKLKGKITFDINRESLLKEINKLKKQYKIIYKKEFVMNKNIEEFTDEKLLEFRNKFRDKIDAKKDEMVNALWG